MLSQLSRQSAALVRLRSRVRFPLLAPENIENQNFQRILVFFIKKRELKRRNRKLSSGQFSRRGQIPVVSSRMKKLEFYITLIFFILSKIKKYAYIFSVRLFFINIYSIVIDIGNEISKCVATLLHSIYYGKVRWCLWVLYYF